jgi:predicted GH43/DUF377 family glycosyl hydrolase
MIKQPTQPLRFYASYSEVVQDFDKRGKGKPGTHIVIEDILFIPAFQLKIDDREADITDFTFELIDYTTGVVQDISAYIYAKGVFTYDVYQNVIVIWFPLMYLIVSGDYYLKVYDEYEIFYSEVFRLCNINRNLLVTDPAYTGWNAISYNDLVVGSDCYEVIVCESTGNGARFQFGSFDVVKDESLDFFIVGMDSDEACAEVAFLPVHFRLVDCTHLVATAGHEVSNEIDGAEGLIKGRLTPTKTCTAYLRGEVLAGEVGKSGWRLYLMRANPMDGEMGTHKVLRWSNRCNLCDMLYEELNGYSNVAINEFLLAFNGTDGAGTNYRIGIALYRNGFGWTKYDDNPVLTYVPGTWEHDNVKDPYLVYVNGVYYLYYTGFSLANCNQIGLATSPDGITWTKYAGNPVVTFVDTNNIHRFPVVVYDTNETNINKRWKMWYKDENSEIGYAYSPDGYTWTKFAGNPVLQKGGGGTWDDNQLAPGTIYYRESTSTWYLYYQGNDGSVWSTGLATFTDPEGVYTKAGGNPILTGKVTSSAALTADLLSGNKVVTIADTTLFEENEMVWFRDNNTTSPEQARIYTIDSPTQLTLYNNVVGDFTVAQTALIRSAYNNGIIPRSIWAEAGRYYMGISTFQVWSDLGVSVRENSALAESGSLTAGWDFNYDAGFIIPNGGVADWDRYSAENPAVILGEMPYRALYNWDLVYENHLILDNPNLIPQFEIEQNVTEDDAFNKLQTLGVQKEFYFIQLATTHNLAKAIQSIQLHNIVEIDINGEIHNICEQRGEISLVDDWNLIIKFIFRELTCPHTSCCFETCCPNLVNAIDYETVALPACNTDGERYIYFDSMNVHLMQCVIGVGWVEQTGEEVLNNCIYLEDYANGCKYWFYTGETNAEWSPIAGIDDVQPNAGTTDISIGWSNIAGGIDYGMEGIIVQVEYSTDGGTTWIECGEPYTCTGVSADVVSCDYETQDHDLWRLHIYTKNCDYGYSNEWEYIEPA